MTILAIETSCDETAIAIIKTSPSGRSFKVLSNIVLSQVALHATWGGVVPNLAKREHQKNLVPLLMRALSEAKVGEIAFSASEKNKNKKSLKPKIYYLRSIFEHESELLEKFIKHITPLGKPKIDYIAVTNGPGLEPTLWVGVNFARALSAIWNIPLVGINHMEGHIFSALIEQKRAPNKQGSANYKLSPISYPALSLLVSGGHTELVIIKKPGTYKIIGETRDDAAGEAFDKVARILKLGYPGGPQVSREAELHTPKTRLQNITLPRPMINTKDFDFSFSGLKTAVLYLTRNLGAQKTKKLRPAICKEFQNAVVEVLMRKTILAAKQYKIKTILLGGGVAANKSLRENLVKIIQKEIPKTQYLLPNTSLTGDNALMIAAAATVRVKHARKTAWKTIRPDGTLRL